jgi:hypothetical protein
VTSQAQSVRTFARARDVHASLARVFGPALKPAGFRRVRPGVCAFARERADRLGYVTVGVQVSQWGSSWSGNSFTLNAAGAMALPEDHPVTGIRPLSWLTAEDCAEGLAIEQRIRARFPLPPPDHEVWVWAEQPDGDIFRRSLEGLRVVNEGMWKPGHDIWLPYFDVADVWEWGEFLRPRILPLLERAEDEHAAAMGRARDAPRGAGSDATRAQRGGAGS